MTTIETSKSQMTHVDVVSFVRVCLENCTTIPILSALDMHHSISSITAPTSSKLAPVICHNETSGFQRGAPNNEETHHKGDRVPIGPQKDGHQTWRWMKKRNPSASIKCAI